MPRLVIVDGNAIVHRAYHALPPLTTKDGVLVNAVYGFTSMLLRVWNDIKPTHLAVTFDVAGGTFRHTKYEKYKATRVKADQELYDQIPLAHEVVSAFNIPIYEKKGYEADDLIGTIVTNCKKQNAKNPEQPIEIYIVTGDKDTIQLIDENTKVFTLKKGINDTIIYDPKKVKEIFGFTPEQMIDYKSLAGDSSDNIPGVPGIGEKTAKDLITKFGSLEEIYKILTANEKKIIEAGIRESVIKKLIAGKESAKISYELATIDCNVPDTNFSLEDCKIKEFDHEKITSLFQKFEFVSLLKRLPGEKNLTTKNENKKRSEKKIKKKINFKEISTVAEIDDLKEIIKNKKNFTCREITSNKDVFNNEILGMAIITGDHGYFINKNLLEKFYPVFSQTDYEIIGHDLKQLIKNLAQRGVKIKNKLFDTMIASYLTNPGSRAHDVASIILKKLGEELTVGTGQDSLFGINKPAVVEELSKIFLASEKLKDELQKTNDLGLMEKVEMPLLPVLAEIEMNGVAVDLEMLKKLSQETAAEIKKVSTTIFALAGEEFNISSPAQLREILFEKMAIPIEGIKKGKTGLSTGAEQLEKLRDLHPIIPLIETYRELEKLRNTYIDVLPTLINPKTGRIHTTFNQAVTATGRLSSSDPNLQNIPIRTELGREVRKVFIAEPNNILVSADYSQIELRIVASMAEDKKMMEIFENDLDIHRATAAAINNVPLDKVTKEMRRAAKEINFGVLYGMGTYGLSWRAEIPVWQAKQFIEKYFSEFNGVKKYLDHTLEFTRNEGYCETLFGRRRYIPELKAQNFQLRSAAERMAINHPIQGTAADLIKMAMIEIEKILPNWPEVKMILQVHDELVFEIKKGKEKEFGEVLKKIMENVVKLRVPIKVEINYNHSWGEMK